MPNELDLTTHKMSSEQVEEDDDTVVETVVDVVSTVLRDALRRSGRYTGPVISTSLLPHGNEGTMLYDDEILQEYSGPWRYGRFHGHEGRLVYRSEDVYHGPFVEGLRQGTGTMQWKDQRQYTGDFHRDKRHGEGSFAYPDGSIYIGSYVDNQRSGYGTYQAEKVSYQGTWIDGVYEGEGVYTYQQNGHDYEYRGSFANGKPHGTGILVGGPHNTTQHDGEWREGQPFGPSSKDKAATSNFITVVHNRDWHDLQTGDLAHYRGLWHTELNCPVGNGTLDFQEGPMLRYDGCFQAPGVFHGEGRLQWRNGDIFEGNLELGQRHGKGQYWWPDGRHHCGMYNQNLRHGYGRFIYPNNDCFEGNYVMGKREGQGRFEFADGSLFDGTWKEGCYDIGKLVHSNGRTYIGQFKAGVAHGIGVEMDPAGNIVFDGEWVHGHRADRLDDQQTSGAMVDQSGLKDDTYLTTEDRLERESPLEPGEVLKASRLGIDTPKMPNNTLNGDLSEPAMLRTWAPSHDDNELDITCEAVVDQDITDAQGNIGKYTGLVTKDKLPHGVGRMVYADGKRIHDGFWIFGNKEGHGRCLFLPQHDWHEGIYHMNLRHGPGRYCWADRRTFVGSYKNDKRHGRGIFLYPSGDRFEGFFADGARSGHGQFTFEDGNGLYIGEWAQGKYHGKGKLVLGARTDDPLSYEGDFELGVFHGYGVQRDAFGHVLQAGTWINGKLKSEKEDEADDDNNAVLNLEHALAKSFPEVQGDPDTDTDRECCPSIFKVNADLETISM